MTYNVAPSLEEKLRYAVHWYLACVSANAGAVGGLAIRLRPNVRMLLQECSKKASENLPTIESLSNPTICGNCGKQLGTNIAYAQTIWPNEAAWYDNCGCKPNMSPALKALKYAATLDMIAIDLNVPFQYVVHYEALEIQRYHQRKLVKINELSRYATGKSSVAGFDLLSSLS
jgi:hypothetical protein